MYGIQMGFAEYERERRGIQMGFDESPRKTRHPKVKKSKKRLTKSKK